MKNYTTMTPVDEPIEIRLVFGKTTYVLCAWLNTNGTVGHQLMRAGSPYPEALTNVSRRGSTSLLPAKAVQGWQAEVVAWAKDTCFGDVMEVR